MTVETPLPLLLKSREAAKALSVSERTLWTLSQAGLVQQVRIGRSVRYSMDDLREFIASSKMRTIPANGT